MCIALQDARTLNHLWFPLPHGRCSPTLPPPARQPGRPPHRSAVAGAAPAPRREKAIPTVGEKHEKKKKGKKKKGEKDDRCHENKQLVE